MAGGGGGNLLWADRSFARARNLQAPVELAMMSAELHPSPAIAECRNNPLARRLLHVRVGEGRRTAGFDAPVFARPSERQVDYRDYRICFHRTLVGWICQIRRQDLLAFAAGKVVCATLEEGVPMLLARARARIDAAGTHSK